MLAVLSCCSASFYHGTHHLSFQPPYFTPKHPLHRPAQCNPQITQPTLFLVRAALHSTAPPVFGLFVHSFSTSRPSPTMPVSFLFRSSTTQHATYMLSKTNLRCILRAPSCACVSNQLERRRAAWGFRVAREERGLVAARRHAIGSFCVGWFGTSWVERNGKKRKGTC